MRTLLRLVTWRHVTLEPLRSGLMIMGIALGVAVFAGVRALNETTLWSFGQLSKAGSARGDLIVEGGYGGLESELVARLRSDPDVAAAAPIFLGYARPSPGAAGAREGRRYLVMGLDLMNAEARAVYGTGGAVEVENPAAFMAPQALLVSNTFAAREGLEVGAPLPLFTAAGERRFVVAGRYRAEGIVDGLGGDVMLMALPAAQLMFGRPGKVDRVVLKLREGAELAATRTRLRGELGVGYRVEAPEQGGARVSDLLGRMRVSLSMASLLALIIGQFLIYNTMSMAVVRRRSEIGVLRALGSTRRHLALLWYGEAFVYGVVGALVGLALGLGIAQLSLGFFASSVSKLYVSIELSELHVTPLTVALALLSGPLATMSAAALPVREALRVAPVEAARKDLPPADPGPMVRRLGLAGLTVLLLSLATTWLTRSGVGFAGGALLQVGLTMGFALCAPFGVSLVTRLMRPVLSYLLGPPGALAGDNLLKSPGRSGITVAALMVAVGGVLSLNALVFSLRGAVDSWLDSVITGDLYVSSSTPLGTQDSTLMERQLGARLAAIPGVALVDPMRFTYEQVDGKPSLLIVMDADIFAHKTRIPIKAGDLESGMEAVRAGRGALVSSNYARIHGVKIGDRLQVTTPSGPSELEVVMVVVDYSSEHGTVFVDRRWYDQAFGDDGVSTFKLWLDPKLSKRERVKVADAVRERWGARYDLFVLDADSFRGVILETIESSFEATYAMEFVAICIALLGVINTLFAAVLERTREIGVLRALGASRSHVRLAVVSEAFLLGGLAGGFGVTCGVTLGVVMVVNITSGAFGWQLPFVWPVTPSLVAIVVASAASGFAGLIPAERAAGLDIVEALAYE